MGAPPDHCPLGPHGRPRTRYFAPIWLARPSRMRAGSRMSLVLELLRASDDGRTLPEIAETLSVSVNAAKSAVAGLMGGPNPSLLALSGDKSQNIVWAADRVILHLRWDRSDLSTLTLDWLVARYDEYIIREVADQIVGSAGANGIVIYRGLSSAAQATAERVGAALAAILRRCGHTAEVCVDDTTIRFVDGGEVVDLDGLRRDRALQLLRMTTDDERMDALLLLLANLRGKRL